jgi:hypothetical protein
VAERHLAEPADVQPLAERPRAHRRLPLLAELVGAPLRAEPLGAFDDEAVGVAADEERRWERDEQLERLRRERTGDGIAADDDRVDALPFDLGEHGLERGQIRVDVVERRDAHVRTLHTAAFRNSPPTSPESARGGEPAL